MPPITVGEALLARVFRNGAVHRHVVVFSPDGRSIAIREALLCHGGTFPTHEFQEHLLFFSDSHELVTQMSGLALGCPSASNTTRVLVLERHVANASTVALRIAV